MDPLAVLRTIWQHRIVSIPVVALTALAALYVFQFAPRSYESSVTFALINPDIPSELDRVKQPELDNLNTKNPYLRSSDPSLIAQVLLTKLNDHSTADLLERQGLSGEYTANRGVSGINGFLIEITGIADTPDKSIATTQVLGQLLEKNLYEVQKVNGADDVYLFSSILVASPDKATEQFSSRLRSLIVVFLAGAVLMFGAVSMARAQAVARERRLLLSGDPFRKEEHGSARTQNNLDAAARYFDAEDHRDAATRRDERHGRRLSGVKQ